MRVLIATESTADQRKALAAVRSLGRRPGVEVTVATDIIDSDAIVGPCELSRYCTDKLILPSPVTAPEEYANALVHEISQVSSSSHRRRWDVFLPLSDHTTIPAVRLLGSPRLHSNLIATALPPPDAYEIALDKFSTGQAAQKVGIETPRTWCVESSHHLESVVIPQVSSFPCVFKLRRGAGGIGLSFPNSPEDLREAYRQCTSSCRYEDDILYDSDRPIVQERLTGRVEDACLLFDHGRMVAGYSQERLAMYPQEGGPGIHNRSTDRADVVEQGRKLLESLQWHGPAMVEFLRDDRTGRLCLLEINPRFWGTLDLAIHAGVDFPWLTSRIALRDGWESPQPQYMVGLEYRWIAAYAFRVWKNEGWSALWSLLRPGKKRVSDLSCCWSDPMPLLGVWLLGCRPMTGQT